MPFGEMCMLVPLFVNEWQRMGVTDLNETDTSLRKAASQQAFATKIRRFRIVQTV